MFELIQKIWLWFMIHDSRLHFESCFWIMNDSNFFESLNQKSWFFMTFFKSFFWYFFYIWFLVFYFIESVSIIIIIPSILWSMHLDFFSKTVCKYSCAFWGESNILIIQRYCNVFATSMELDFNKRLFLFPKCYCNFFKNKSNKRFVILIYIFD